MPEKYRRPVTVADSPGGKAPENSELRKLATSVLKNLQYGTAAMAAEPAASVRRGSYEESVKTLMGTMKDDQRARWNSRGKELTALAPNIRERMFGPAGKLDAKSFLATGAERVHEVIGYPKLDRKLAGFPTRRLAVPDGVKILNTADGVLLQGLGARAFEEGNESAFEERSQAVLKKQEENNLWDRTRLEDIWGPRPTRDEDSEFDEFGDEFEESAVLDKLKLVVTQVKCVDETNPEWPGDGRIRTRRPLNWRKAANADRLYSGHFRKAG